MDRADMLNAHLAAIGQPTFIYFGPHANCTLELCSATWNVYGYRPSLWSNIALLSVFSIIMILHIVLGLYWKTWSYLAAMVCGCLGEIAGYTARAIMYQHPWSFEAFMVQIVFITTAPIFYCAAIYVLLAKIMRTFAPNISLLPPRAFYYIFIPFDILSLLLQGIGGALSAASTGTSEIGAKIAVAGLAIQATMLLVFLLLNLDFIVRYHATGLAARRTHSKREREEEGGGRRGRGRGGYSNHSNGNNKKGHQGQELTGHIHGQADDNSLEQQGQRRNDTPDNRQGDPRFGRRMHILLGFQILAVVLITIRCVFRVKELGNGYGGDLVRREDLFIGLEGIPIVLASLALCAGHPGLVFRNEMRKEPTTDTVASDASQRTVSKSELDDCVV